MFVQGKQTVAFTGATPSAAGSRGSVPAPAAGQDGYQLQGDAGWVNPNVITFTIDVFEHDTTVIAAGSRRVNIPIPPILAGYDIVDGDVRLFTAASGGATKTTVQIVRTRSGTPVDVFSTEITVNVGSRDSYSAAVPPVVNVANDDLAQGDFLGVDVDVAGGTTPPVGMWVELTAVKP
jgi:hypothetical protein